MYNMIISNTVYANGLQLRANIISLYKNKAKIVDTWKDHDKHNVHI